MWRKTDRCQAVVVEKAAEVRENDQERKMQQKERERDAFGFKIQRDVTVLRVVLCVWNELAFEKLLFLVICEEPAVLWFWTSLLPAFVLW